MPMPAALDVFAESLAPVEECLNREAAVALVGLPANPRIQARVDELAAKCNEGRLSAAERSEYEALIWADHFLGILQAKARHFLRRHAAA